MGFEIIFLNTAIIAINSRSMPDDIQQLAFDDPLVKTRFRSLIDKIINLFNERVVYISLGNEVDTYFSAHPGEWVAYIDLITDARIYLKTKHPNIKVGVTTTFMGASATEQLNVSLMNTSMDVVILTYYPVNNNFSVREPTAVESDANKMILLSAGKPLIMQEWGYPSSAVLGSSEEKQADFFKRSFASFKQHGVEQFPFVS